MRRLLRAADWDIEGARSRWEHVDLDAAVLTMCRSIKQWAPEMGEKDRRPRQQRRVALNPETVAGPDDPRAEVAQMVEVEVTG